MRKMRKKRLFVAAALTTVCVMAAGCAVRKASDAYKDTAASAAENHITESVSEGAAEHFEYPGNESLPIYYTDDISPSETSFSIESFYVTDRAAAGNHYYVEDSVLWGTGRNYYWQLGLEREEDRNNLDSIYDTPVKIAENVVHIDASDNGYFLVYLTADHKLYGLGANTEGVLLQSVQEFEDLNYHINITGIPVLLMEHVQFVSAGRKSLTVLTDDGDVYWWGKFQSTTATDAVGEMSSTSPKLMVSQARYTACGADFALAIDRDNRLWTWGNNVWGQCGTAPNRDYITQAVQVCSQTVMAWPECITFRQNTKPGSLLTDEDPYGAIRYPYTLFIKKEDGCMYACGINLGNTQKTAAVYGDLRVEENEDGDNTFSYSSGFVKINTAEAERMAP